MISSGSRPSSASSSAPAGNNSARRSASALGEHLPNRLLPLRGQGCPLPARPPRSLAASPSGLRGSRPGVRPQYRSPRPHTEHRRTEGVGAPPGTARRSPNGPHLGETAMARVGFKHGRIRRRSGARPHLQIATQVVSRVMNGAGTLLLCGSQRENYWPRGVDHLGVTHARRAFRTNRFGNRRELWQLQTWPLRRLATTSRCSRGGGGCPPGRRHRPRCRGPPVAAAAGAL